MTDTNHGEDPSAGYAMLRGCQERIFDVVSQNVSREVWGAWLEIPLELASANGDARLAKKLATAGATIGISLHEAIRGGHKETVRALLEVGVCPRRKDGDGDAPLHVAARGGHTVIAQLLLDEGADKDALDITGRSPLHIAAEEGSLPMVNLLLAAGADLGIRYAEDDENYQMSFSPLDVAAWEVYLEVMRAMIQHGGKAVVNATGPRGRTALHIAAVSGDRRAIDVLVEAGADINATDSRGFTPLHEAATWSNNDAALALLGHGAKVDPGTDRGDTPLHLIVLNSIQRRSPETVEALLRWGADETIKNLDGVTPPEDIPVWLSDEENAFKPEVERVKMLLLQAPADRAWRRRGYLVLCRAFLDRVGIMSHQQSETSMSHAQTATAPRTRGSVKRAAAQAACAVLKRSNIGNGSGRTKMRRGGSGSEWTIAAGWVVGLKEDGLFRNIMGYL